MRTAVVIAVTALLVSACGSDDESSSSGGGSGGTKVSMTDNAFSPKTISGKAGSTVEVALSNNGQAEHTFTVDSQKIDKELEAGDSATVSVTIPKSGSVEFYCRYHRRAGMVGTLGAGSGPSDSGGSKSSYY